MKPTVLDIRKTGDLGGQKIAMQIDEAALIHLQSVLTNLYSNPCLAMVRETMTNAHDSHVAAGQTRPIEVTTPGALSPFFKVKDYGVGMDIDDIINIYSKYGASTKRGSDDYNGMLGLGAKAPLTYTNQFSVIAIKNGVKINILVGVKENGAGGMEIVSETLTDEPNGVEVVVPSKAHNEIVTNVDAIAKVWRSGTILVNGVEPSLGEGRWASDTVFIRAENKGGWNNRNEPTIVMGNVPYIIRNFDIPQDAVIYLPIGSVNFTPSREELHYTDMTNQTIRQAKVDAWDAIRKMAAEEVEKAPTYKEALAMHNFWTGRFRNIQTTYKGKPIPGVLQIDSVSWQSGHRAYEYDQIGLTHGLPALVVVGKKEEPSTYNKRKVKDYCKEHGIKEYPSPRVFFVEKFDSPWAECYVTAKWDDIMARKLAKPVPQGGLRAKRQAFYNDATADYDPTKPVVIVAQADIRGTSEWKLSKRIRDIQFMTVPQRDQDRIRKGNPQAVELRQWLVGRKTEAWGKMTDLDKTFLYIQQYTSIYGILRSLKGQAIEDAELKSLIKMMDGAPRVENYTKVNAECDNIISTHHVHSVSDVLGYASLLEKRYPLVFGSGDNKDRLDYINHMYKTTNQEATP